MIIKRIGSFSCSRYDLLMMRSGVVVYKLHGKHSETVLADLKKITNVIDPGFENKSDREIEAVINSYCDTAAPLVVRRKDFRGTFFLMQAAKKRQGPIIFVDNN